MNINLNYPTSWEEVTRKQLLIIASYILKGRSREDFLLGVFCKITGIRIVYKSGVNEGTATAQHCFAKGRVKFLFPLSTIHTACEELSFILEKTGLPECPILPLSTKLHGVSFKQYYFANAYFHRYQQVKDISLIHKMHEALTGKQLKKIEPHEVLAITIWWSGLQSFLKEKYPNVFSDEGDPDESKTPADTLQEILAALNNNKPQENDNILNSEVHSVFHALQHIYLTNKTDNS